MLIIPLTGKLSKDNLPVLTIIIILINAAVFFTVQYQDSRHYREAEKIYFESGLADMELKYYEAYQNNHSQKEKHESGDSRQKTYIDMLSDDAFQDDLTENKIITPQDPLFEKWRELRDRYESSVKRVSSWQYGFIPKKHEPFTIVSHMFMHGSFMHLLGNMIFLWLVGCVLELGLGRVNYVAVYLLGGLFALGLFYFFNMQSATPLVGASGAISGLMGAYTVAYGKTKINVFYSLGFYFNYTRVHAIILLPLWILAEVLQLIFLSGSRVAYLAHIGGLAGGAVLGFINVRYFKKEEHKVFEEDPKEKIKPLLEEALKKIEILDMTAARELLLKILAIDPANDDAVKHLYAIDKLHPDSPQYHQTAAKRLSALCKKSGEEKLLTQTFTDYCRHAGKPQLNGDLLLNISRAFTRLDQLDEAEALVGYVFSIAPHHPRLSAMWMELAGICQRQGRHDLRERCTKVLSDHFSDSPEAKALQNVKRQM